MAKLNRISVSLLLLLAMPIAVATPQDWFERMRSALQNLDYQGRFVYQVGDDLEALYIVHRVDTHKELERVVKLNGPDRELIRGAEAVAYLLPGGNLAGVLKNAHASAPPAASLGELEHYEWQLLGLDRVAGRAVQVLDVAAKDEFRYGHRIYLEQTSGLPLRLQTRDAQGQLVAQMMFVDLEIGQAVPTIEHDVSALALTQGPAMVEAHAAAQEQAVWGFTALPPGFAVNAHHFDAKQQRHHLIVSDGLATVSVMIEPLQGDEINGASRIGAVNSYATRHQAHQVVVMGEVPQVTLTALATALVAR